MQSVRYIALPLLAVLIWSVNTIVTKLAADVIEPASISFYRWFWALLILTPFMWRSIRRDWALIRPYCLKLMGLGSLGMVVYQGLSYTAAETTSATNMGLIVSMMPVLTIVCTALILRERPNAVMLVGAALSFVGMLILISRGTPQGLLTQGVGLGDGLMLLAVLAFALYGVLLQRWHMPISNWQSLYMQILFGVLLQIPLFLSNPITPLNSQNVPLVLYAAIFPSLFAPLLWMQGLQLMGPNKASLFINLVPVFTVLIAVVFLGEILHSYHLWGGLLTLAGVILAQGTPIKTKRHRA